MGSFLTQVEGFTPLMDIVVQDVGLIEAAVYGNVWRYCQMKDGVCRASMQTIADNLSISRRTAMRHIDALCKAGYLKDLTPDLRHKPHTYADTGKARIVGLLSAREGVPESHTNTVPNGGGVTENHTRDDKESHPGVTESHTKKLPEDTIEDTSPNGACAKADAHKPSSPKQEATRAMFGVLAQVCQIDLRTLTAKQRGQLNQSGKVLRDAGIAPADVTAFGEWWLANDWRGQRGDPPRPAQVRETWGQFDAWRKNGGSNGNRGRSRSTPAGAPPGGALWKPPADPADPAIITADQAAVERHEAERAAKRAAARAGAGGAS